MKNRTLALFALVMLALSLFPALAMAQNRGGDDRASLIKATAAATPPGGSATITFGDKSQKASGVGSSVSAVGTDVKDLTATKAPDLRLDGGQSATGGSVSNDSQIHTAAGSSPWKNPLFLLGLTMGIPAGWFVYRKEPLDALACGLVGAGLVAASLIPAWAWVGLGLAVAAGVGIYLWTRRSKSALAGELKGQIGNLTSTIENYAAESKTKNEALRAVVAGVELAPDAAKAAVKSEIAKQVDGTDRETIRAVKVSDGLI